MSTYTIRKIQPEDNQQVKKVIQNVLIEMGVPKVGTAYEDASLNDMYAAYHKDRMDYFVLLEKERIVGCAGIAPLEGATSNICELQKMYFLPEARGKGAGAEMMKVCLNHARNLGFEQCYLETLPYMESARKLYARTGFRSLEGPLGNTGHYSCTMWMIKDLSSNKSV